MTDEVLMEPLEALLATGFASEVDEDGLRWKILDKIANEEKVFDHIIWTHSIYHDTRTFEPMRRVQATLFKIVKED